MTKLHQTRYTILPSHGGAITVNWTGSVVSRDRGRYERNSV